MGLIEKYKDGKMYFQIENFNLKLNMNMKEENQEISGFEESEKLRLMLMLNIKMKHLFTSRIGWDQKKIFKDLSQVLELPEEKIYRAKQVHGNDVLIIKDQDYKDVSLEEKDGFITNLKGVALATYHADCVPLYFYDWKKQVIGLAHAGWKGTLNNIASPMVEGMIGEFNSKVEDIRVAIGPSIGPCCYEVGEDLVKSFGERYSNNKDVFLEKKGKIYLDLWKINKINLLNLGIKEDNIFSSNYCTSCRVDKLYSYRKEKGTKNRMVAAISLEE